MLYCWGVNPHSHWVDSSSSSKLNQSYAWPSLPAMGCTSKGQSQCARRHLHGHFSTIQRSCGVVWAWKSSSRREDKENLLS